MYDREIDYNFLTSENNAKVHSFSSQTKGCVAANIINNDRKVNFYNPEYMVIRNITATMGCYRYKQFIKKTARAVQILGYLLLACICNKSKDNRSLFLKG
jgi:hypothetical protein